MGLNDAINVTESLIDHACKRDSSYCMIAEAIKAAWPWATYVSVDVQTIRVSYLAKGERLFFLTPRRCQIALLNFDQGNKIEPFQFRLRQPHIARTHSKRPRPAKTPKIKVTQSATGGAHIKKTLGRSMPEVRVGRRRSFGLRGIDK